MSNWLKRIRAAVGIGLTWAIGWGFVGALLLLFGVVTGGIQVGRLVELILPLLQFSMVGFVGGGAFSVILGLAGRRRRFDEMSLPRFAGWGALGSLLVYVAVSAIAATLSRDVPVLVAALSVTGRGLCAVGLSALVGLGQQDGTLIAREAAIPLASRLRGRRGRVRGRSTSVTQGSHGLALASPRAGNSSLCAL